MERSNSSKKKKIDCLGFGINALDYLLLLDHYPKLDEKIDLLEASVQGGGPVPTALVTLARLGAKVAYIGKIGKDPEGEWVLKELKNEKVNTDFVLMDEKAKTAKAIIWVDKNSGKRSVVLDRSKIKEIKPKELNFLDQISAKYVHLDAREMKLSLIIAKWAKKIGAEVILDAGSLRKKIELIFPFIDYLVVSKKFALDYTKIRDPFFACEKLYKLGFKAVVVTIGKDGAICASSSGIFHQPAFLVRVVDTTGAGDVFHGGFIYGLLKRWKLKRTVLFATACAAMKCRRLGGRAGIPRLEQVKKFLKTAKIDPGISC